MLSIIVPVFNEEKTILSVLNSLFSLDLKKEIIVVNDGSTDRTKDLLDSIKFPDLKVIHLEENKGKAFAVKEALKHAGGDYVVFQDADLEYPVENIKVLYSRILSTGADMVIGIRTLSWDNILDITFGSFFANKIIRKLTGCSDVFSGHRIIKKEALDSIDIESSRFELETELLLKFSMNNYYIDWVSIKYIPRSRKEGKKIGFKDFISIMHLYFKLKYFSSIRQKPVAPQSY